MACLSLAGLGAIFQPVGPLRSTPEALVQHVTLILFHATTWLVVKLTQFLGATRVG